MVYLMRDTGVCPAGTVLTRNAYSVLDRVCAGRLHSAIQMPLYGCLVFGRIHGLAYCDSPIHSLVLLLVNPKQ